MKTILLLAFLFCACFTMTAFTSASPPGDTVQAPSAITMPAATVLDSTVPVPIDYSDWFISFAVLVGIIPFITEAFKKLVGVTPGIVIQIFSWLIGLILTGVGWYFGLGFLHGIEWYYALMYGIGAALASNGIFDTGMITWLMSMFIKK